MEFDKPVGELVAEDYRMAEVFKKFGIDFCCGGKRTVKEACERKGVDYATLRSELAQVGGKECKTAENFNEWGLDLLAEYIVQKHHAYVKKNIPLLLEFSEKVATVHGNANPEVVQIASLFRQVADEMQMHMMKEERGLFPYIKDLVSAKNQGIRPARPHFGTIRNPVNMMEAEHDTAGNLLKQISELSNNYTPPVYACNTYRVEYHKLKEFEDDLHQHVHLENNILFPKAIELEAILQKSC